MINLNINTKQLYVEINMLNFCNYLCWYCGRTSNSNNIHKYIDINIIIELLSQINQNYNITYVSICGNSEPMLHPNIYQLVSKLQNIVKSKIEIVSNLSLDLDLYIKLCKLNNVILLLSYHNINNSINNDFIKKISILFKQFPNKILCTLMLEPLNIRTTILAFKILRSLNIPYIFHLMGNIKLYQPQDIMILYNEHINFNELKQYTIIEQNRKILFINFDNTYYYDSLINLFSLYGKKF